MKRIGKPLLLVCLGVVLAFPLFSLTYYTMVRTSTPLFCASCHEIQPAYNAWRTSSHTNNSRGVVADCMDCHLPAPHDTYDFFFAKTMHGIKDVIAHFTEDQSQYDHALNRPLQKAVSGYSPPQMTTMGMIPQHRPSTTMTTAKQTIKGC